jgi:putative RNA 2'-phosphotransferase
MNEKQKKAISKFLSLILRHSPETIDLSLDSNGWADVEELLLKSATHTTPFTREELEEIVVTNDKQRFIFNEEHTQIRANQGHSIQVELNLQSQTPPEFLYHGTVEKFLSLIRSEGLKKINRHHVHLSKDKETAEKVGNRRGKAIILTISSGIMYKEGFAFYLSENGVWLTDNVPVDYINFNKPNT